ncbi:MAG: C25 family cysteine peptidase [Candidatus Cloacimonadaceae bacterium]
MKKTAILIMAIAVLQLICMSLWAVEQVAAKPFVISTKSAQSMEIQFKVPEFEIEKELESGKVWDRIKIKDAGYLDEIGLPELPILSTSIAVPNTGHIEIEIISTRTRMLNHVIPYPSQDGNIDGTPKAFRVNEAYYRSNEIYPQETISYSDPQILRDFRIITVQVQPFAYNPLTSELEVREEVDIRLRFTDALGINELQGPQVISPSFAKIYESMILNFDDYRGLMANTPPRYLMIYGAYTDPTFQTKINDFAFWKKQKGADVRLVSTTVTGNTTTDIKAYIQGIYNDINARPDYIVLIGDTTGSFPVPTWPESFSSYSGKGDYPYQHLAGDDYLGDVFLGRISAENTSQLDVLFAKIYAYEKTINVNTAQWLDRMLLVGDTSPSGQSTVYTNKYIKDLGLHYNPDYTFTEIYAGDPSPAAMNTAINQGVGFFNYRGYIGMSGWSPGSSLVNGSKLPHAMILTCSTGNFAGGTATSEAFMRLGTASVPAGAITATGMYTSGTHTMYNNALDKGVFNGIFTHGMRTMGEAILNGKLVLHEIYNQTRPNQVKYFAHWMNLMGDPTVEVYCKIPDTFISNVPLTMPAGTSYMDMIITDQNSTPVEGACVTISQGNIIMARGYTDETGRVYLFLNTVLSAGGAEVTVSKHEFKPLQSIITVDGNGSLVGASPLIDDDNVGSSIGNGNFAANSGETLEVLFAVRNTTIAAINNVTGFATCSSPYVNIINDTMNFATIDAGVSNYSLTPVLMEIDPTCPHNTTIRFDLFLTDANDSTYVVPTYLYVSDAFMNFISYQVMDGGNSVLDPNETANFTITVKNNGTVPVIDLYGQLITMNDLVNVVDNIGYFGNIQVGTQVASVADMFQLAGRPQMLPGMLIPMRLRLYNDDGFLQWVDFTLTVGNVTSTDPLGPDAYGYVIYDETDTSYEDCPTYNWIGIAPAEGGSGTQLSITDTGSPSDEGDAVGAASIALVDLPFPFTFYGETYNQISVCSNGFIVMGVTENGNYRNFRLPGSAPGGGGAPSPLIAPFWDDLITTGGGVFKWYDSTNHLFVIEWYQCKNGKVQTAEETFQIILYDPAYYPTSMGDGPIKIQYKVFNNVDTGSTANEYSGNYCTIGIQNYDQTIGLEYSFNNTYPTAAAPLSHQKALYITNAPVYHYTPHLFYDSAYVLDNNNNTPFLEL